MMDRKFRTFKNNELIAKYTSFSPKRESIAVFIPGYFSATSLGPNRLFVEIEESLSEICNSSYRVDWPGMGDNRGNLVEFSFNGLTEQLIDLFRFLSEEHGLKNINLIAHSMGALLIANCLHRLNIKIPRVILLSPIALNRKVYTSLVGETSFSDGRYVRKGVFIHKDFVSANFNGVSYKSIGLNSKEVVSVMCSDDPYTLQEDMKYMSTYSNSYNFLSISEGGHNFLTHKAKNECINFIKSMEW